MSDPSMYGRYYWCVKSELSESGEIYVHADEVEVTAAGVLVFWRKAQGDSPRYPNLAIAADMWKACFAASLMDGSAVAVEHWKGEVAR